MTLRKDFKKIVRARMAETGEPYTAAHAALRAGQPGQSAAPIGQGSRPSDGQPTAPRGVEVTSEMLALAREIAFTYYLFERAIDEANVVMTHPLAREVSAVAESIAKLVATGTLSPQSLSPEQLVVTQAAIEMATGPIGEFEECLRKLMDRNAPGIRAFLAAKTIKYMTEGGLVDVAEADALDKGEADAVLRSVKQFTPGGARRAAVMASLAALEANAPLRHVLRRAAEPGSFFAGFDNKISGRATMIVYGDVLLMAPDEVERIPSQPIKAEIQRLEEAHAVGNATLYVARRSKNVMITTLVYRGASEGRRVIQDNRGKILTGTWGEKDEIALDGTTRSGKTRFTSPGGEVYSAEW